MLGNVHVSKGQRWYVEMLYSAAVTSSNHHPGNTSSVFFGICLGGAIY